MTSFDSTRGKCDAINARARRAETLGDKSRRAIKRENLAFIRCEKENEETSRHTEREREREKTKASGSSNEASRMAYTCVCAICASLTRTSA